MQLCEGEPMGSLTIQDNGGPLNYKQTSFCLFCMERGPEKFQKMTGLILETQGHMDTMT